jgi:hypothetical protein
VTFFLPFGLRPFFILLKINGLSNSESFMTGIASTSGRLHSEFVRLLFLQAHRETNRFFAASGVLSAQSDRGFFHYLHTAFSAQFKIKVGLSLAKAAVTYYA